ncbi:MAG: hypothetical protein AAFZ89_08040 [Bacteroidota bacterium]
MTSDLRKTHKILWLILAMTIPILVVLSVLGIREQGLNDNGMSVKNSGDKKELVLENDLFTIYKDKKSVDHQLLVFLKKSLPSPAASVYAISSKGAKGMYLGELDKKGVYHFKIKGAIEGLQIYDEIKKEEITNVALQWD